MAKKTIADAIEASTGKAARSAVLAEKSMTHKGEKKSGHNRIGNLGDWAHPPKRKK